MKKILFISVLIIYHLVSIAQSKQTANSQFPLTWQAIKKLNQTQHKQANEQLDSIYLFSGTQTGDTILYSRYYYEYNETGKIIGSMIYYLYYSDKPMYPIQKLGYSYNENNLLETVIKYGTNDGDDGCTIPNYKSTKTDWFPEEKQSFIYDENNRLIEIHNDYTEDQVNWVQFTIDYYTYDNNNNLIKIETQHKGDFNTEFSLYEKTEYKYDDQQKLTEQKKYTYYSENWQGIEGKKYAYNNNNVIIKINLQYDDINSIWQELSYNYYTYDENHNQITNIEWYETGNIKDTIRRTSYKYISLTNTETAFPITLNDEIHRTAPEYFTNAPITETSYIKNGSWLLGTIANYYYTNIYDTLSTINIYTKKQFQIYPNPSSEFINISIPEEKVNLKVEIFTLNGQKIKSIPLINNKRINISDLKKGNYLIQIRSKHNNYKAQKLIIN